MTPSHASRSLLLLGILTITSACDSNDRPSPGQALPVRDASAVCGSIVEHEVACYGAPDDDFDAQAACEAVATFVRGDYLLAMDACLAGIDPGDTCEDSHRACFEEVVASVEPTATATRFFEALAAAQERCPEVAAADHFEIYTDGFLDDMIACFDEPTCDAIDACQDVVWDVID